MEGTITDVTASIKESPTLEGSGENAEQHAAKTNVDVDAQKLDSDEKKQIAEEKPVIGDSSSNNDSSPAQGPNGDLEENTMKDKAPGPELADNERAKEEEEDEKARIKEEKWREERQKLPRVVDVKWLDYEHFKNVYNPDEGLEIIQVLRGHQRLASEMERESRNRQHKKQVPRSIGSIGSKIESASTWPQRVRIQSQAIMLMLSRLARQPGSRLAINEPYVFFRPFRTFYHYLPQIKKCLRVLENRWGHKEAGSKETSAANGTGDPRQVDNGEKVENIDQPFVADYLSDTEGEDGFSNDRNFKEGINCSPKTALAGDFANSVTGLQHIRKFVQFIEEDILPEWEEAKTTTNRKVRFVDLWMYFLPGELLHVPPKLKSPRNAGTQMHQTAWRCSTLSLDPILDVHPDDWIFNPRREFEVLAYYIDYDGDSYGPVESWHTILYYEGEKDITTLDIYPMRFVQDHEQMTSKLYEQGKIFQKVITDRHLHYDGWTLPSGPSGSSEPGFEAEHIDGAVIVDFVEGSKADSSIQPIIFRTADLDYDDAWTMGDDAIPIRHWIDGPQAEKHGWIEDLIVRDEPMTILLRIRSRRQSNLLENWGKTNITHLEGLDLALLPRRAVAYALRERKFVMVDIHALRPITPQQNVFKDLKIDEEHKHIVMSLVKSHFKKQKLQKQQPGVGLNQDLIRGKGSGLFILLHGVPGVGKTATAEAVAQSNKRPLFAITCGDLGFSPKEVEVSLGNIFRLAHLWDCVLLLDEADIFLTRREHNDLKRNALVSVFLRVLEYYSGILFLTTNRVGILDEAFKSRIHISMYYPPLSREYTIAIFDVNIRKLHAIEQEKRDIESKSAHKLSKRPALVIDDKSIKNYAAWHYDNREPHQRWNGRQIRNAFQIAYSLADFDIQRSPTWEDDASDSDDSAENGKESQTKPGSKLDYRQFQVVDKAIVKFDRYLLGAMKGNTDTDYARLAGTRDDDHESNPRDQGPVYFSSPRPRPPRQSQASRSHPSPPEFDIRPSAGPSRRQGGRQPEYKPSPPEYPTPEGSTQPRSKRRLAPQEPRLGDHPRASPSRGLPRSRARPSAEQEYELGYSGWNTTKSGGRSSNAGYSNEEYNPDEGANSAGGEEYYDDYEEET